MANEEHLKIIRQSVAVWNKWREKNPDIIPDFSNISNIVLDLLGTGRRGAQLNEADVNEAYLRWKNLCGDDFIKADLLGANLEGADLHGENLKGANLKKANLKKANLSKASLRGSDLSEADLSNTDLSNASLCGASLRGTSLYRVNLVGADLRKSDLSNAWLYNANLLRANFEGANLKGAYFASSYFEATNLKGANLSKANLSEANLSKANLSKANLSEAELSRAILYNANLRNANLSNTNLTQALLIETNLESATLDDCKIFGISAWKLNLNNTKQKNLVITDEGEPIITVDNLEVAQFIYVLLHNEKIRDVINTITTKVVLILGRFTKERKAVLDAIRDELRKHNFIPVMFDFKKPTNRNFTETIKTLAHLARFIIADITDAKSIPQELEAIVPRLKVPVQPLLEASEKAYGMFEDYFDYPWVLNIYRYDGIKDLMNNLKEKIIAPAEAMAQEFDKKRQAITI